MKMRLLMIPLTALVLTGCSTMSGDDEAVRRQSNELTALRDANRHAQEAIDKANARIKLAESRLAATEAELKSTQAVLASTREKCGDACRR